MSEVATFAKNVDGSTEIIHPLGERGYNPLRIILLG